MGSDLICNTCMFYERHVFVRQTLNQKRVRGREQDYMDCSKGIQSLVANQCAEFIENTEE